MSNLKKVFYDFLQLQCLKFVVSLGDSIIQNGGNSAVGIYVIQLAKFWNIRSINVIRDRPDLEQTKEYLKSLGADYVLTEEEIRKRELMDKIFSDISKPKLALNCVGGQCATDCVRHLDDDGTMVTYGGMSKKPVVIPTGSFIFKNHKYVGYWQTRWNMMNFNSSQRHKMLEELTELSANKKLITPKVIQVSLDEYKEAIENMQKGFSNAKYVFKFD